MIELCLYFRIETQKELYAKLVDSMNTRIASEKGHVERMEMENQRYEKLVSELEQGKLRYEDKLKILEGVCFLINLCRIFSLSLSLF